MSKSKTRRSSFFEFASGALPGAFSAQVLGDVPNVVDDEEDLYDDDELDNHPDHILQLKLHSLQNPEPHPDRNDDELFGIIKDFLGYEEEEWDVTDDLDDQSVNSQQEVEFEKHEDEVHNRLLAAINDLRDEIRGLRSDRDQAVGEPSVTYSDEQEESWEEDEQENTKQARARQMFTSLVNQGMPRQDIIDQFMKQIGVTQSTATSYYQRLAKEAGLTSSGDREFAPKPSGLGVAAGVSGSHLHSADHQQGGYDDPTMDGVDGEVESNIDGFEVEDDPDRQGLIRTVKGAHLVYKRKNEEGTFDELWVFGTGGDIKGDLQVRRAILAGTDIPPRAIKSENGQQSYTLTTMGNGQLLHIKGLPN
jgi:hypothetical protein